MVTLGTLTVHLDTTVNVALPAMSAALDAPIPAMQWIIIGYVLTTASALVAKTPPRKRRRDSSRELRWRGVVMVLMVSILPDPASRASSGTGGW